MRTQFTNRARRSLAGAALVVAVAGVSGPSAGAAAKTAEVPTVAGGASVSAAVRTQTLITAAKSQIGRTTLYDPSYVRLAYPGGDVPMDRGVCTDVVIRAYRAIGIDLQVAVHDDMLRHFSSYPRTGRRQPDPNIDHRRVRNLITFFSRSGAAVPTTQSSVDYHPGDVVMWDVGGLAHTGLVADVTVPGTDRHLIVHNIGDGAQLEDILFAFPITGHFRYSVAESARAAA